MLPPVAAKVKLGLGALQASVGFCGLSAKGVAPM
jgi:hypothetical protein